MYMYVQLLSFMLLNVAFEIEIEIERERERDCYMETLCHRYSVILTTPHPSIAA